MSKLENNPYRKKILELVEHHLSTSAPGEFADRLDIARSTVTQIKKGKELPPFPRLNKLADVLEQDPTALLILYGLARLKPDTEELHELEQSIRERLRLPVGNELASQILTKFSRPPVDQEQQREWVTQAYTSNVDWTLWSGILKKWRENLAPPQPVLVPTDGCGGQVTLGEYLESDREPPYIVTSFSSGIEVAVLDYCHRNRLNVALISGEDFRHVPPTSGPLLPLRNDRGRVTELNLTELFASDSSNLLLVIDLRNLTHVETLDFGDLLIRVLNVYRYFQVIVLSQSPPKTGNPYLLTGPSPEADLLDTLSVLRNDDPYPHWLIEKLREPFWLLALASIGDTPFSLRGLLQAGSKNLARKGDLAEYQLGVVTVLSSTAESLNKVGEKLRELGSILCSPGPNGSLGLADPWLVAGLLEGLDKEHLQNLIKNLAESHEEEKAIVAALLTTRWSSSPETKKKSARKKRRLPAKRTVRGRFDLLLENQRPARTLNKVSNSSLFRVISAPPDWIIEQLPTSADTWDLVFCPDHTSAALLKKDNRHISSESLSQVRDRAVTLKTALDCLAEWQPDGGALALPYQFPTKVICCSRDREVDAPPNSWAAFKSYITESKLLLQATPHHQSLYFEWLAFVMARGGVDLAYLPSGHVKQFVDANATIRSTHEFFSLFCNEFSYPDRYETNWDNIVDKILDCPTSTSMPFTDTIADLIDRNHGRREEQEFLFVPILLEKARLQDQTFLPSDRCRHVFTCHLMVAQARDDMKNNAIDEFIGQVLQPDARKRLSSDTLQPFLLTREENLQVQAELHQDDKLSAFRAITMAQERMSHPIMGMTLKSESVLPEPQQLVLDMLSELTVSIRKTSSLPTIEDVQRLCVDTGHQIETLTGS